jgi:hypothetical protein
MQLTLQAGANGNQPLIFQVYANQAHASTSAPQVVENTEYVLQSLCVDGYCERVAFLLVMTTYAPGTLTASPVQGGYIGGQPRYVTGRSSKGYLFRRAAKGQMEQSATVSGTYSNVSQALIDLGAYN